MLQISGTMCECWEKELLTNGYCLHNFGRHLRFWDAGPALLITIYFRNRAASITINIFLHLSMVVLLSIFCLAYYTNKTCKFRQGRQ